MIHAGCSYVSCFRRITSGGVPRASRSALYIGTSKSASSMCVTSAPEACAIAATTCASLRLYEPVRVLPAKIRTFMATSLHHRRRAAARRRSLLHRPQERARQQAGEDGVGRHAHREVDASVQKE